MTAGSNPAADLLAFLEKLHDRSSELLGTLRFDKRPEVDGYVVCLYATMIELTCGIVVLTKKGLAATLPSVFRSFLEAFVDFKLMTADPSYINNCYAQHHKNWVKILTNAAEPNPFLAKIQNHEDREPMLKWHNDRLQKLRDQGVYPLQVRERFKRADLIKVYDSVFAFESDGIHSNMSALTSRHIVFDDEGFSVALYKERGLDDFMARIDSTAGMLMDATRAIHNQLNSEHKGEVQELSEMLELLRATYCDAQ